MASSLSQDEAQILFRDGAILVFLDVPEGTEFGIDYNSWQTGPEFRGVKMIPPGIHFVYYSSVSRDGQAAPRTGFFHDFGKHEMLIKKWDKVAEDMSNNIVSQEEQDRFESNRQNLDRYLGAYPYDSYRKWMSLSNYLTIGALERLQPTNGKVTAVPSFESIGSTTQSRRELARQRAAAGVTTSVDVDDEGLPIMKRTEGTQIRFSQIPLHDFPIGSSAAQITQYSIDRSYALQNMVASMAQPNDILCEIQFAFICFLIGHVYEAFEHWKELINLMCSCEKAVQVYPELFSSFIFMMHCQIEEVPSDFFVDIVERENFLVVVLRSLFDNLNQPGVNPTLHAKAERFQRHLHKKFKWDFEVDQGEFAPVIVE